MPIRRQDVIHPSKLRILMTVLQMAQDGEHMTVRSVSRKSHGKSRNSTWILVVLHELRDRGLVAFEDGDSAKGTLRPTCYARFYPEETMD